jgi:hypothetical protein
MLITLGVLLAFLYLYSDDKAAILSSSLPHDDPNLSRWKHDGSFANAGRFPEASWPEVNETAAMLNFTSQ